MCTQPASFKYTGLTPDKRAKIQVRMECLLCIDHSRDILWDMGWHIQDREIKLERLDKQKLTTKCIDCYTTSRVEIVGVRTIDARPGYCPNCSMPSTFINDPESDYWEILAESFDGMKLELLKMLHDEWLATGSQFRYFRKYVEHVLQEDDDVTV